MLILMKEGGDSKVESHHSDRCCLLGKSSCSYNGNDNVRQSCNGKSSLCPAVNFILNLIIQPRSPLFISPHQSARILKTTGCNSCHIPHSRRSNLPRLLENSDPLLLALWLAVCFQRQVYSQSRAVLPLDNSFRYRSHSCCKASRCSRTARNLR